MRDLAAIFGCSGLEITPEEKKFYAEAQPWGFILFARNLDNPAQIQRLTAELRASVGRNVPILIDQEGGRVARLKAPHWLEWMPPLDQMAAVAPENAERAMWLRYRIIAHELLDLGIDVDCAPMADVATPEVHPVVRNRCYGSDPETVIKAGRAVAEGLLAGGVLPVLKHIPGHGRPHADSHAELPRTAASYDELSAVDFAAFRGLCDLPMGMTAHVVYEAIDPNLCATLSPTVIKMIREDIGFDGLLMSDDLSMSALQGSEATRAAGAIAAGCDLVLHCNGTVDEMTSVANVTGRLTDAAQARADRALAQRGPPEPADIDALLAEVRGLLKVGGDG